MSAAVVLFWALVFLAPYLIVRQWPAHAELLRPLLALDHFYADEMAHLGRRTPDNPKLVFLGIDNASLELGALDPATVQNDPTLRLMKNPWPWSREIYAALLDRLIGAGAKLVIFDLLFDVPHPEDAAFKASLDRHADQVVLGGNFSDTGDGQITFPSSGLIPPVLPPDQRVAFVNFWPDFDGSIRRTCFTQIYQGASIGQAESSYEIPSLSARAATIAQPGLTLPKDDSGHLFRYTGPRGSFATASVYEVFDPDAWHRNFQDGAYFRDKIVMIGPLGNFHQDQHETPLGKMDGAEIHLQALNAILHREFLTYTGDELPDLLGLVLLASLMAWSVGLLAHRGALMGVILGLLYLAAGLPLFSAGIVLAVAAPFGVFAASSLTSLSLQYVLEQRERSRTRRLFERYVSPEVVREIVDNPASYYAALEGRRREVTVLFSDLRGFTTMTEQADSEQLVRELNEYLHEMTKAVFAHKGVLDKFIGDAVMAVWGSFVPQPAQDAKSAVQAALAMIRALAELNVRRAARGQVPFAMGIGIHHGEAVVGDIGAEDQKNFTVIGDTVNLASRLEGVTKEYGVELVISAAVAELVRAEFHLQTVDFVRVKGRSEPVRLSTVLEAKSSVLSAERLASLEKYEAAMKSYLARDFSEARAGFSEAAKLAPEDQLAAVFAERCAEYENDPPAPDWDGVYAMTTK